MFKRTIFSVLTAACIFLAAAPCRADGPAPIALDECIRTALENNHAILAESGNLDAARAGVGQAASYFLPKIGLSETYMRSDNPVMAFGSKLNQGAFTAADFAVNKLNNPDPVDNFNFRAELIQPVFNGGKEIVGLRRARLGLDAAGKNLERAKDELVFQVVSAYYGVALAREYTIVADMAYDTTERHLKTAQQFYDQGMLVGSEVLLAKVRLAEVRQMRLMAQNRLSTSKAALNMLMGRAQDTAIVTADPLEEASPPDELASYLELAVNNRPDLDGMRINVRNMEEGVTMAKTGYLPNLNFIGRYELDDKDPFRGRGDSYTIMGVLSWNIFDGFLTTKQVEEAKAKYNATSHMQEQMKEGVQFEVRQAYNSAVEARQRVEVARAAVTEGEEALRIIEKRFATGLTKTLDVLDAETALTRARTSLAQALYDQNVSMAGLDLASGSVKYRAAGE